MLTEEEKKALKEKEGADAAAKAEADKAEFEASLEGLSKEEKDQKIADNEAALSKKNNDDEDKKALEIERQKRLDAEDALKETRRKAKERYEAKQKKDQEVEENGEEPPTTRKDVHQMMDEERESFRKEMQQDRAKEEARSVSGSDAEADLTFEIWKNRKLSGSIKVQMEEAYAIATYQKTRARNGELKRALNSKDGEEKLNLNAQREKVTENEPKINPTDKTVLKGMIWDNARGAYKKTIAGGRKIFYVSRDMAKRWVENV